MFMRQKLLSNSMLSFKKTLTTPMSRHFCTAKVQPAQVASKVDPVEETEETDNQLKFIRNTTNLRQVFIRAPEDGYFPAIKHVDEMEAEDVELLVKNNLSDILKSVIDREKLDPKLTHALIG